MQQPNSIATMYDIIGQAMKPYTELMDLTAIWLEDKITVRTHDGRIQTTKRIYPGCIVNRYNMDIVSFNEHAYPHFKIVACRGTINNTKFEIDLENLDDNKIITIKL